MERLVYTYHPRRQYIPVISGSSLKHFFFSWISSGQSPVNTFYQLLFTADPQMPIETNGRRVPMYGMHEYTAYPQISEVLQKIFKGARPD